MKAFMCALRGSTLGAMPGLVLLAITVPVSGEAELTLGVAGLVGSLVGAVIGTTLAISAHREQTRR